MEKILIFIKHHFSVLWKTIEWSNGILFSLLHKERLDSVLNDIFKEIPGPPFFYRRLILKDLGPLHIFINGQSHSDLEYFRPHGFDLRSILKQFNDPSFLMMGAFEGEKIVGYFFLRFFANGKCFVGRLIGRNYRGKGIGLIMNSIMYETSWRMRFRCLSTISKNNKQVMQAHSKNSAMVVLKELNNSYLLVEFLKDNNVSKKSV